MHKLNTLYAIPELIAKGIRDASNKNENRRARDSQNKVDANNKLIVQNLKKKTNSSKFYYSEASGNYIGVVY